MKINNRNGWTVDLTPNPHVLTLLPLGTEVSSILTGRSKGIIIGYNASQDMFYHRERYPYVILWEDGYFEVYGRESFSTQESTQCPS